MVTPCSRGLQSVSHSGAYEIPQSVWYRKIPHDTTARPGPPHYRVFTIILKDTPLSVEFLWTSDSVSKRPLTTHNTYKRQTSTPGAGFEPAISVRGRP